VTIFWLDLEEVKGRLKKAAQKLAKTHPEVAEVWLFGSLARGEAAPGSDADLLIVLERCALPFPQRSPNYQPEFCGLGVDVFPYTRAELEEMAAASHPFILTVMAERTCLLQRRGRRP
jgi:predicted nucleotidyltransferase